MYKNIEEIGSLGCVVGLAAVCSTGLVGKVGRIKRGKDTWSIWPVPQFRKKVLTLFVLDKSVHPY